MFRSLLICLMLFTGSAQAADNDFDAVKKAAEQGQAEAQYSLGGMYDRGEVEVARYYRKVAEQGDAGAQYTLGIIYHLGFGVPKDDAEAVRWYRKAAEQGHSSAQFSLGFMYDTGEGVPEDDIQAYAWISIAAAQGAENAKEAKEILTGEMTPAEITEAQKLFREYWEAYGPGLNSQ